MLNRIAEKGHIFFMSEERVYDCIIVGAGPGGLQAAIYLGRYNRDILLIDRGGGRTHHARAIENFLSHRVIPGKDLLEIGAEQARSFKVHFESARVIKVLKKEYFEVYTEKNKFLSRFIIVSSGGRDNFPPIENIHKFLGTSFFTCVDCDGHKTTGKKLLIVGNAISTVRLAFAMKEMYTKHINILLYFFDPPEQYKDLLNEEGIILIKGRPARIVGDEKIEALDLQDGKRIGCEVIMSDFGFKLNDDFLDGLPLKKDGRGFKYVADHNFESSLDGLYIVGPLNTGHDQAIIAAGEGAVAAIEINRRLLDI